MKTLNIVLLSFIALSSCGQTVSPDLPQTAKNPPSRDALAVYQSMTSEICDCTLKTMRESKPSTTLDSCYKAIVKKCTDTLKTLGYDPSSPAGYEKLLNGIKIYQCHELNKLSGKEWEEEQAKKLLFKGTLVSQKQLPSGEIEIVMTEQKTKEERRFISKSFLMDPAEDKNTISYEMTVEYEVRVNPKTKQNDYYIKEGGQVMSVGVMKAGL